VVKKKTLEKIELQELDIKKSKDGAKYQVTAKIINLPDGKILMVNMYENETQKKALPLFRLFITKKEDMFQDTKAGTWYAKKIESLPGVSWGVKGYFKIADKLSDKVILNFLPGPIYYNCIERIQRKQEEFRSEKTSRAWKLRVERIDNQMKLIDRIKPPKDIMKFIDKAYSDQRYIFYKAEKNQRYVNLSCPHCGMKERLDSKEKKKPRHNEVGICPSCGSRIIYKATGRQDHIRDIKEIICMHKLDTGFVSRYFDVYRENGPEYETYRYYEKARVIYNGSSAKTYYRCNDYYSPANWWDSNGGAYGYHVEFGKGILYTKNLDEVLDGTTFKYCAIKQLAEHNKTFVLNHSSFLYSFEKRRFIEYFIKMGLYNLTNDYVTNSYSTAINTEGANVQEILMVSKQQINRLIELDGNLYSLKLLQLEEKNGLRMSNDQISFMTENEINIDNLKRVLEYTTVGRAIKYIKQNGGTNNMLSDWCDYIYNGKVLGYNLHDEFVLFPRHFKQAHDISTQLSLDKKNEYREQEYIEIKKELINKYSFRTKTFAVVIPEKLSDITMEGQKLHHCVGTYIERVMKQETAILFIRRVDNLQEPFYTMEVKNGLIIQVRGLNNKATTPAVEQFVDSFRRRILDKEQIKEAV